jgi:triphosphatase
MADPIELELKLEFDPADRERLETAQPLKSADAETNRLVSTYFDTPAEDLRGAGYSLRVRRHGRQRIQTVKAARGSSAGLFARPEWERPVKGDRPLLDGESGPLVEEVGAGVLDRIEAVFVTDVKRTIRQLDRAGTNIELAIDDGEVRAGNHAEQLSELELELRGGSPQALFDLARQLNEQAPLRLGVRSKAERGYALFAEVPRDASKAEPIMLDRNGDAGDAFCVIAQACVRHFRLNEALLLQSGDAESLHQARVGLRRLRCAFSLYKGLLVDDGATELLRAELRWLAAELGEVRNIDVLIPRCDGDARDRLAAARDRTFEHVRTELASSRTRLLMIDLTEWLAIGAWRTRPADPARLHQNILPFSRDLLDSRRDRLKRRGKGLAGLDDAHRHEVRIEAKKLRYAAEFFGSLHTGSKARRQHRRFVGALKALQDLLGELNDLVTGPDVLAKLGIDATLPQSGKRKRQRLLEKAEKAYEALIGAKCFWRA